MSGHKADSACVAPVYSWYDWLPYAGKGLMVANRPWDSTYNVTDTIWITAHTTQFTSRGWFYLGGNGCALLPEAISSEGKKGGSYVSLVSPGCTTQDNIVATCDLTIIIETVGASKSNILDFELLGSLSGIKTLYRWTTEPGNVFKKLPAIDVQNNILRVTVPPDNIWTLTTKTTGSKGNGASMGKDQPQKPFPMPYDDDFERYKLDTLPLYFSDMHGAFAVAEDDSAHTRAPRNNFLRQQASSLPPLATHGRGANAYAVAIGATTWTNYNVSMSVRIDTIPNVSVTDSFVFISSHLGGHARPESTYHSPFLPNGGGASLQLHLDGSWVIVSSCNHQAKQECTGKPVSVANGTSPILGPDALGKWLSQQVSATY